MKSAVALIKRVAKMRDEDVWTVREQTYFFQPMTTFMMLLLRLIDDYFSFGVGTLTPYISFGSVRCLHTQITCTPECVCMQFHSMFTTWPLADVEVQAMSKQTPERSSGDGASTETFLLPLVVLDEVVSEAM